MRASQRERHSLLSPSTRNSAVLMTPDPTSTPMETVMDSSPFVKQPLVDDGPQREVRAPEGPRVDRIGADVDGHVAVVLLQKLAQLSDGRFVLSDAPCEGELVRDPSRARDDGDRAQHDRAVQPRQDVLALLAEGEPVPEFRSGEDGAG